MRLRFWRKKKKTQYELEVSYIDYQKAQEEHRELGECIKQLRKYQETLCPYLHTNAYVYNVTYHNPELHVAIEDRIKKIVQMQTEIKI